MTKVKNELMNVASASQLAQLAQDFPQEPSFTRIMVPRIGLVSQDKTEKVGTGKTAKIEIIAQAGTFFTDKETDEEVIREDGTKAKEWKKEYLDEENPEIIVLFQRKQLRYFDESDESYTSSPIFDRDDEQVVLFKDRKEVARGTPTELKALYPSVDSNGKPISKLKDEKILYVLYANDLYQMNLHGSSMWSFTSYARKVVPPTVITILGSEAMEKGSIAWNKMTFEAKRQLTSDEAELAMTKIQEIKDAINSEKQFFGAQNNAQLAQAEKALLGDDKF
jgi:hypothetical protein